MPLAALPNEADRRKYLCLITLLLPKPHRDTMEVLFVFLKWVASFAHVDEETGSKMDLTNLATVICPNILYSKAGVVRDESFLAIRCVTQLLEQQDELYIVPDELMPILADQEYFVNALDMKQRDFMKKCETYMKLKAGKIRPGDINMPSGSLQGTPMPTPGGGPPPSGGESHHLAGQRSDPQISRGRQQDQMRPPPPMRDRHTNSLERGDSRHPANQHVGGSEYPVAISPPPQGVPHSYSHPPGAAQAQMPLSPRGPPPDPSPWHQQHQQHQRPQMAWNGQHSSNAVPGQLSRIQVPPQGAAIPAGPQTPSASRNRPLSWTRNGEQGLPLPPSQSLNGHTPPESVSGNYGRP